MDKTLCTRLESAIETELLEIAEAAEHRKDGMSPQMIGNTKELLECLKAIRIIRADSK